MNCLIKYIKPVVTALIIILLISGCSGDSMTLPANRKNIDREIEGRVRDLWGLWSFVIDPDNERIDYYQIRSGEMHLNALSLMEPPANELLSIEGVPEFSGGTVTVDIGLRHPVIGLVRYTGFDVKGIVIGHGEKGIPDLIWARHATEENIRLLNPDGYTRWWNPEEFPYNEIDPTQGYIDGLLGVPNETEHYTATMNPYKYFCDALQNPDDPIELIPVENRGYFSAGAKNVRTYVIDYTPSGLTFNYAVDANWAPPIVPPPDTQVPDDFPEDANQPEPYRVVVYEIDNSLAYDISTGQGSGELVLDIEVYDWNHPDQVFCCAYADNQELFGVCAFTPFGGGEGYSTYHIETAALNLNSADDILLWVNTEIQSPTGYGGHIPFEYQTTLWPYIVKVEEVGG